MTRKMENFSYVILKFWSPKVFSVLPNSAPSLSLWLHVTTTSFICVISAPACLIHSSTTSSSAWCMGFIVPPHMVFQKVQGWDPSTHRLHVLIWSPLTACDVLGQLYADDV